MHILVFKLLNLVFCFSNSIIDIIINEIYDKFKCKNRYIHFYQFEIFAIIKLLKNNENNKKICDDFS